MTGVISADDGVTGVTSADDGMFQTVKFMGVEEIGDWTLRVEVCRRNNCDRLWCPQGVTRLIVG